MMKVKSILGVMLLTTLSFSTKGTAKPIVNNNFDNLTTETDSRILNDRPLKIWQISDIHVDYYYNETGNPEDWCHKLNINESLPKKRPFGNYRCDASPLLVKSAIEAMARRSNMKEEDNADIILWTGDTSPHWKEPNRPTWEYIYKVENDIVNHLTALFPESLILPVLGNHDAYPPNVFPEEESFYQKFLNSSGWKKLVPEEAQKEFGKCGFYRQDVNSGRQKLTFLILNTNLYYRNNYTTNSDPCSQLSWLDEQLNETTSKENSRIFILAHVPPGYFERDTTFGPFMQTKNGSSSALNDHYIEVVTKYCDKERPGKIVAHFYGHTHTDSFRLLGNDSTVPAFISGSITPLVNKQIQTNPTVRLYEYDGDSTYLGNYHQYWANLQLANKAEKVTWEELYDFQGAYNVKDLSADSLQTLVQEGFKQGDLLQKYIAYNTALRQSATDCNKDESCRNTMVCTINNLKPADLEACMKRMRNAAPSGRTSLDMVMSLLYATITYNWKRSMGL